MIEKRNDWQERLSPRVNAIAPSGIRKFFDIAERVMSRRGLSVGDADRKIFEAVREVAARLR